MTEGQPRSTDYVSGCLQIAAAVLLICTVFGLRYPFEQFFVLVIVLVLAVLLWLQRGRG
jgi:hypothetical protein